MNKSWLVILSAAVLLAAESSCADPAGQPLRYPEGHICGRLFGPLLRGELSQELDTYSWNYDFWSIYIRRTGEIHGEAGPQAGLQDGLPGLRRVGHFHLGPPPIVEIRTSTGIRMELSELVCGRSQLDPRSGQVTTMLYDRAGARIDLVGRGGTAESEPPSCFMIQWNPTPTEIPCTGRASRQRELDAWQRGGEK